MYILKNAWISITRNRGRNILIGIIILIIASACTITLSIKHMASDLINSYEDAYEKEVTIGFDRSNMMKDFDMHDDSAREEAREKFNSIASYTVSDVEKFADSDYITDYYYTYSIGLNGNSIKKVEEENSEFMGRGGKEKEISTTDFTVTGASAMEAMNEFISGTYEMEEITDNAWDIAFDGNYCFINKELADYNDLKLNDKITLKDEDSHTYEFEIIGIFEENSESETEEPGKMSMFSSSANTIITNVGAVSKITDANTNVKGNIRPTFIINSYEDLEKLSDEFHEKGLDENYVLETNEEEAKKAVSSVENVNSFATTFLVITLIIGGVVLFVINMINIRERKYEIGVLRTIGISKLKLTLQFVSELLIVAFVALALGCGLGAVTSKSVSNSLLKNEISNSNAETEEIGKNFGGRENMAGHMGHGDFKGRGVPVVQAYDSIDAVVDITVLLELFGIGLSLVLVSSISAMISIQRFSPLTILKERS